MIPILWHYEKDKFVKTLKRSFIAGISGQGGRVEKDKNRGYF